MAATAIPVHLPTNAEASSHLVTNLSMDGTVTVKDAISRADSDPSDGLASRRARRLASGVCLRSSLCASLRRAQSFADGFVDEHRNVVLEACTPDQLPRASGDVTLD
jgi:hypothetical protein